MPKIKPIKDRLSQLRACYDFQGRNLANLALLDENTVIITHPTFDISWARIAQTGKTFAIMWTYGGKTSANEDLTFAEIKRILKFYR